MSTVGIFGRSDKVGAHHSAEYCFEVREGSVEVQHGEEKEKIDCLVITERGDRVQPRGFNPLQWLGGKLNTETLEYYRWGCELKYSNKSARMLPSLPPVNLPKCGRAAIIYFLGDVGYGRMPKNVFETMC